MYKIIYGSHYWHLYCLEKKSLVKASYISFFKIKITKFCLILRLVKDFSLNTRGLGTTSKVEGPQICNLKMSPTTVVPQSS